MLNLDELRWSVYDLILAGDRHTAKRTLIAALDDATNATERGEILGWLGDLVFRDSGDSTEARRMLLAAQRLLAKRPAKLPVVLLSLAMVNAARGDIAAVQDAANRARHILDSHKEAEWCWNRLLAQRSKAFRSKGRFREAINDLHAAITAVIDEPERYRQSLRQMHHVNLAWCYLRIGSVGDAERSLKAVGVPGGNGVTGCYCAVDAEIHAMTGDVVGARRRLAAAPADLNDPDPALCRAIANITLAKVERNPARASDAFDELKRLAVRYQQEWIIPVARREYAGESYEKEVVTHA